MKYLKQYEHWLDNIIQPPEINRLIKSVLKFLRSNYKDMVFHENKTKNRRAIYYQSDDILEPPYEFMEIYFSIRNKRVIIDFSHKAELIVAENFLTDIIRSVETNDDFKLIRSSIYLKRTNIPKVINKIEEESENFEDYKIADKYNL